MGRKNIIKSNRVIAEGLRDGVPIDWLSCGVVFVRYCGKKCRT